MTFRSVGAVAVVLLAVSSSLVAATASVEIGLVLGLLALAGLSIWTFQLARALAGERAKASRNGFLARLPRELSLASDEAEVWRRATAALGSYLGATRVALYHAEQEADPSGARFHLFAQFAEEDVRPLDPSSSFSLSRMESAGSGGEPMPGGGASSEKQLAILPTDAGRDVALVIYRASADEPFLLRFHVIVQSVAELVLRRASQARLAELRSALLHLAHALASTQEPEATLDLAVTASAPLARCQGGAVFVDEAGAGWRTAASFGLAERLTPAVMSRLLPRLDEAVKERVPIPFGGFGEHATSFLIVPMFHGRELMGVLLLGRDGESEGLDWDETDLEVARLTAQLTATSLKNAGRLEDLLGGASRRDGIAEIAFDFHVRIGEQGTILDCNAAMFDALKYKRAEIEGRRLDDFMERRSSRDWRARLRELFRKGALRGESVRLLDAEGEPVDVVLNGFALSPHEATLVMKNVSESSSLRSQLQQSQKQEVLGLLASGIAHDLNNVLGGVLGYASLARRQSTDPQLTRYMGTIERSATRGAALTGRLLAASRRSETRYEPVSVNHLARETLEILSHSIAKNITIETQFDPAVRAMMADPGQIQQILLNLCVNARDAMPNGGVLRLTTRLSAADGRVQLSIEDSGVGMDPKTLERLFEPFFSTKGSSGTGLGLSVVYNIVESLSGEIRVASAPGKGSRFDIFLPCLWVDEAMDGGESEEPLGQGELVLLVDDEKVMRELGRDVLEAHGYRVQLASSGEEAIDFVEREGESVSLVVLDLVMPGLDGTETYRRLKAVRADLPILLSSGLSAEDTVTDFLADRATDFLGKPYGTGDLARAVRAAIAGTKGSGSGAVVH